VWWTVLSETWSALSGILTEYLTVLMAVSTVVTAIATLVIAIGIVYTARQFKFSTWLKAQEIFTGYKLTKSRTQILQKFPYYKKLTSMIGTADEQGAALSRIQGHDSAQYSGCSYVCIGTFRNFLV